MMWQKAVERGDERSAKKLPGDVQSLGKSQSVVRSTGHNQGD